MLSRLEEKMLAMAWQAGRLLACLLEMLEWFGRNPRAREI